MTDLETKLFDDLAPRADFAKALKCSERTLARLDLPTRYIGRKPYIIVSEAKAKLMGASEKPKRGRPRKAAA